MSPFGTHVHEVVSHFDHVEVVLDDDHGVAFFHQPVQHGQQLPNILEVQSRGGFIQDVNSAPRVFLGKFLGQFHALGFAAAEGGGLLTQGNVAQPHLLQRADLAKNIGDRLEKLYCLLDRHVQHVADTLAFVQHFQGLAVVAPSLAAFAVHLYVGEKIHFDGPQAGAFADFAAAAFYVE